MGVAGKSVVMGERPFSASASGIPLPRQVNCPWRLMATWVARVLSWATKARTRHAGQRTSVFTVTAGRACPPGIDRNGS